MRSPAARRAARPLHDPRLAWALAASVLLHLLLILGWGDGAPRPSGPPGPVIRARLVAPPLPVVEEAAGRVEAPAASPEPAPLRTAPVVEPGAERRLPAALATEPEARIAPASRLAPGVGGAAPLATGDVPAAGTLRESAAESRFAAIPPVVSTGAVSASHAPAGAQPTPVPAAPPGDGLAPGWFAARDLDVLPRPLAPIEFAYPPTARAAGVSGKVVLQLSIDAAGRLIDIEVVRADPRGVFEAAALAAFRAVRYSPGLRDGRAVPSRIRTVAVFDASAVAGSELPR